ncbi:hypothetical protein IB245_15900 [Pseudomonas sp. PDM02]|uniref:hypothetical protein n=1 Tax=Pseudomonas sp. PDM02 TaxID=2769267 RepID=UPI00177C4538|nr:hypothetical protein [Pseudomonas sp. PDM02]MBD9612979.1 hypothetical protein [Pseudomonas sp. PDM02]
MFTIVTKPLPFIMFACAALLSVYQQAAAQTPIKETVKTTKTNPGDPSPDVDKHVYSCDFSHLNQAVTAEVDEWRDTTGKLNVKVTRVHLTEYPNHSEASANLTVNAPGAVSQTQYKIPMDGNWHSSSIHVVGNGGPELQGNMERPYQNGCNLHEVKVPVAGPHVLKEE